MILTEVIIDSRLPARFPGHDTPGTSGFGPLPVFRALSDGVNWGALQDTDRGIVMVQTINQRVAAKIAGDFVVFLIGARLNRRWKFLSFIPIARAMRRMVDELEANRDHGMLHVEMWSGRTTVMVQYWRSFEHLHAYARMRDAQHLPAWADFNRRIGSNGDFGIWHETFMVKAGQYEAVYNNMPEFGLAKAGEWVPAAGKQNTAKGRLQLSDGSDEPVYEEDPS